MNNEIREMLEEMKSIIDTGKDINGIKVDGCGFHGRDLKLLYDYITNLKEENEDYKLKVEKASEDIKDIFKDEKWYENYEYNDLENALKNVLNILPNGSDDNG